MPRLDPDAAIELMRSFGLEPLTPYLGSRSPWPCRCLVCGATVRPRYTTIQQGLGGCARCGRGLVTANDAEAFMRSHNLEPLVTYPGSREPWVCRCLVCGDVVQPRYGSIRVGQGGCRRCVGQFVAEEDAVALMRSAGAEPSEPYPGSARPWRCRCMTCGRTIQPRYTGVRAGKRPCAYCAGKKVDPQDAADIMVDAGLDPIEPYASSDSPWRCRCRTCGGEVAPKFSSVRSGQGGCRFCAPNASVSRETALELFRVRKLEPVEEWTNASTPWRSVCQQCGAEVSPNYANVRAGRGCRQCGRARTAASRRLDPDAAAEIMRSRQLEPLTGYSGSEEPWPCRCLKCGQEVSPSLYAIRTGGGCRFCAPFGLDFMEPSLVYLIAHPLLGAHKVGVANRRSSRLAQHEAEGWRLEYRVDVDTGWIAYRMEQDILRWLADQGVPLRYVPKHLMPQGGYTETFPTDAVLVDLLVQRLGPVF
jgi:recombinational DNA repair protein (RecF pathway)